MEDETMDSTTTETVTEILTARDAAGPDAYLWVHTSGDVILWRDWHESLDSSGENALARWKVTDAEVDQLIDSGNIAVSDDDDSLCDRCGRAFPMPQLDYCAVCSRNLCDRCMALGCCGSVPAKSGEAIDRDGEEDSLR